MPEQADPALLLRTAARELAEVATTVREASVHATAALADPAVPAALPRAPAAGLRTGRALLRAVTDPRGLGWAVAGGRLGTLGARVGGILGTQSLAVRIMMTSLRLRIAAVVPANPELAADPLLNRLGESVAMGHGLEVVRDLHALIKDRGAARTFSGITPIFAELLALHALLDRNPLNDHAAWLIASGTGAATADPVTGMSNRAIGALDVGGGAALRVGFGPGEAERLCPSGSLLGFLTGICVIGPTGRALVQTIAGPDSVHRYVVLAPGMRIGSPDDESPADLLGAFSATVRASGPYSRALARAIADYGIPAGADLALIGHSAGGAAVMSLAQDPRFCARYRVTHVVALGSPIDFKRPASATTWVASVTNQHDLIPTLDGQGAGNCFDLHPDWYVVDYTHPADVFPDCHRIEHYTADLADDLPDARAEIDRNLRPYAGKVVDSVLYRLYDRAPGRRARRRRSWR